MLKLFHSPTTRSVRVLWVLEELGLPYEIAPIGFPPRLADPDYLKLNPAGTVPALVIGDRLMTESLSICDHLAQERPEAGLVPLRGEPGFRDYMTWLWYGEATLMFAVSLISRAQRNRLDMSLPIIADTLATLDLRLADLEQRLAGRDFLACDRFTLADVSCVFPLYRMQVMKIADRIGPNAAAYYDRLSARPAFQAALSR